MRADVVDAYLGREKEEGSACAMRCGVVVRRCLEGKGKGFTHDQASLMPVQHQDDVGAVAGAYISDETPRARRRTEEAMDLRARASAAVEGMSVEGERSEEVDFLTGIEELFCEADAVLDCLVAEEEAVHDWNGMGEERWIECVEVRCTDFGCDAWCL